ncbi:hypothetical protein AAFF27_16625 [Xylophilus sp. GW821-FHT01B05]
MDGSWTEYASAVGSVASAIAATLAWRTARESTALAKKASERADREFADLQEQKKTLAATRLRLAVEQVEATANDAQLAIQQSAQLHGSYGGSHMKLALAEVEAQRLAGMGHSAGRDATSEESKERDAGETSVRQLEAEAAVARLTYIRDGARRASQSIVEARAAAERARGG